MSKSTGTSMHVRNLITGAAQSVTEVARRAAAILVDKSQGTLSTTAPTARKASPGKDPASKAGSAKTTPPKAAATKRRRSPGTHASARGTKASASSKK